MRIKIGMKCKEIFLITFDLFWQNCGVLNAIKEMTIPYFYEGSEIHKMTFREKCELFTVLHIFTINS